MNKLDLIYNSDYVFCIDVYYPNSPKCKLKIHYSNVPVGISSNYTETLEECLNDKITKYVVHNLAKSITLNDVELTNVEVLKNTHIIDYKHETLSNYNFKTDISKVIILHEFKLASYEYLRIVYKFDIKHVPNV
jgi:hypothetical protein